MTEQTYYLRYDIARDEFDASTDSRHDLGRRKKGIDSVIPQRLETAFASMNRRKKPGNKRATQSFALSDEQQFIYTTYAEQRSTRHHSLNFSRHMLHKIYSKVYLKVKSGK